MNYTKLETIRDVIQEAYPDIPFVPKVIDFRKNLALNCKVLRISKEFDFLEIGSYQMGGRDGTLYYCWKKGISCYFSSLRQAIEFLYSDDYYTNRRIIEFMDREDEEYTYDIESLTF